MPLFRKKNESQSQAAGLAPWRSELGPLLDELGVSVSEEDRGWVAEVGGGQLFMASIEDGTVFSGYLELEDTHDAGELAALLRRNLEPRLTWSSLGDAKSGPLGLRFAVPLDGFDRDAVLLALEALGDETLSARARALRDPARGEQAEQAADAQATERVETA